MSYKGAVVADEIYKFVTPLHKNASYKDYLSDKTAPNYKTSYTTKNSGLRKDRFGRIIK